MTAQETFGANFFQTALTAQMNPTDLTATVSSTSGLTSPCYAVIEPDSPAQREIVLFDDTFTGTTLVATALGKRYQTGSAAGSGLTHPIGALVRFSPVWQHLTDINDRVDAEAVTRAAADAALDTRVDTLEAVPAAPTGATFYETKTWTISTPLVESGDTDFIVPFEVYEAAGDAISLAAVTTKINSGTSVTLDITVNGSAATGFSALSATTTKTRTNPTDVALSDGDLVKPDISAVSGSPRNLQVTVVLKHVLTLA